MNYEILENDIKEKIEPALVAIIPKIKVELEPEYEDENAPLNVNPRVTIFLDQSEFNKTKSVGYIAQDSDTKVFLLVRSRKLRGEDGVYTIIEQLRKSLVGFQPTTGFSKMWMVRAAYDSHTRGIWCYVVVVGTQAQIVEDHEPPTSPLLKTPTADFSDDAYNN